MTKNVNEMTPQEFAAKADADFVVKKEAERRKALGLPEPKLAYSEADHAATRERQAAAEARREEAAKLPAKSALEMTDEEWKAELSRRGISVYPV